MLFGKGKAELISAQIKTRCGESKKIVFAYVVPPQKKNWTKKEHEKILKDTLEQYFLTWGKFPLGANLRIPGRKSIEVNKID